MVDVLFAMEYLALPTLYHFLLIEKPEKKHIFYYLQILSKFWSYMKGQYYTLTSWSLLYKRKYLTFTYFNLDLRLHLFMSRKHFMELGGRGNWPSTFTFSFKKKRKNICEGGKGIFIGSIFIRRVEVPFPKIVMNNEHFPVLLEDSLNRTTLSLLQKVKFFPTHT